MAAESLTGAQLLCLPVVGPDGTAFGRVLDVRLVQDGPLLGAFAAMRIEGFVVGKRRLAARLGYDRRTAQRPWLVAAAVRWLLRDNRYARWEDCEVRDGRLHCWRPQLERVPAID